jgi:phage terminase large subunit-like protein
MKNYLQWLEEDGYYVRDTWNEVTNQMDGGAGNLRLFPFQRKILGKALTFTPEGKLPYETVLFSTIKKSGKTAIAASIGAWYAEQSKPGTEIFVIANTQESGAGLAFRDLRFHFENKQQLLGKKYCKISEYRIDFANGTFIQVLAQSYKGNAGSRHALTLWDELWGSTSEADRRAWDEMIPIPTVSNSLRFISTYAGFLNESELLWNLFVKGVDDEELKTIGNLSEHGGGTRLKEFGDLPCYENHDLFCYWDHEPRLPWQTEEYYQKAMTIERPAAFMRLHMNQWVTSHEEYLPVEWWDTATKSFPGNALNWSEHPFRFWPVTVGIDAGIKRDSTALVAVGYDSKKAKLGIVYHKIWSPHAGDQVDLDVTVEKELLMLYNKFKIVSIVYDPTHLMQTMLRLRSKGLPTKQFDQTIPNMTAASQLLYDLFKNRNLEAYPDEELRRHIQMSVAETTSRGFRIVKNKVSKRHHIDGAIALAMAAYEAVQSGGVDISIPVRLRSPYSDATQWKETEDDPKIPFELTNDVESW